MTNGAISEKETSPEEEIAEMERKLEEKKRELAQKTESPPAEKEILREVLQKHIEEVKTAIPEPPAGAGSAPAVTHILTDDLKNQTEEIKKKENREEQIRQLVEIALTKNIRDAVRIAKDATPYLLDELHDHLVDDYYDKLISLRKIKEL